MEKTAYRLLKALYKYVLGAVCDYNRYCGCCIA